jgi:Flp pilus assembly protein TadD
MRIFFAVLLFSASAFANTLDQGLHALVAGDSARAEQLLGQAVREEPGNFNARFNYASALRALGRNDEAVREYRVAVSLAASEPEHANALYGIALARDAQGDPTGWNEYLQFAGKKRNEQAAVRIARERLRM